MKKHSQLARIGFALAGIKAAWRKESSFRTEVAAFAGVLACMIWRRPPLYWWGIILFAAALVFMAELLNTSIENLCDAVHPGQDPGIGSAKDCASAAVLIANLLALAVLIAFLTFQ